MCSLPGTTITLQCVLTTYYALCVSSQALPLPCHLCSLLTKHCVFLSRHYHYTPVCAHYLLIPVCFLPGNIITHQCVLTTYYTLCVYSQVLPLHCHLSSLLTKPCVFPPRHYYYTPACAHYLLSPLCFLPGITITHQSLLTTYYALCVSSQAQPLPCHLCSLLTKPNVFPPKQYHYTLVCAHYLQCTVCFLPGTTITQKSVLTIY